MKLLLTSLGLTNASIKTALVALTGKSLTQTTAIFVPTAAHAVEDAPAYLGQELAEQAQIGWKNWGVLELTALPSLEESFWLPALKAADVIMVGGGNTPYLSYHAYQSGFAQKLPELLKKSVYVGVSAGSMLVTAGFDVNQDRLTKTGVYADEQYGDVAPLQAGSDRTLRLVPFAIRPHLNADYFENVALEDMAKVAARTNIPMYAIDDQTALKVVDGQVEVVSEGTWQLFNEGKYEHQT